MSIELQNVAVRTRKTITPVVLSNLNVRIEDKERFALLGPPKSGVELVVDVICGAKAPDEGKVIRTSSISWPLPGAPFLHKHLSFIANARFVARLYEANQQAFIDQVLEMAEVRDLAEERIDHCPRGAVSRFGFALGACLPFDTYLFLNTAIGEKSCREKYSEIIASLASRHGLIVATANAKSVAEYCDRALVLDPAGAVYYDDIEAAMEHLQRITKPVDESDEMEFSDEEDSTIGRFDDF